MAAIRVVNQFKVTAIKITSAGGKKVTLNPVYIGDPEFTSNTVLYDNSERNIEIYVPKNSSAIDTFAIGDDYYMDFTAV